MANFYECQLNGDREQSQRFFLVSLKVAELFLSVPLCLLLILIFATILVIIQWEFIHPKLRVNSRQLEYSHCVLTPPPPPPPVLLTICQLRSHR